MFSYIKHLPFKSENLGGFAEAKQALSAGGKACHGSWWLAFHRAKLKLMQGFLHAFCPKISCQAYFKGHLLGFLKA